MMRLLLFFLLSLVLLAACEDFLTVPPADELSREETFATLRGAEAAVIGLYNQLGEGSYYRNIRVFFPEMAGNAKPALQPGDNVTAQGTVSESLIQAYDFRYDPDYEDSNLDNMYEDGYSILYQANDILTSLPQLTEGLATQRNSLRAEALVVRALVHFDLVRTFAQAYGFTPDNRHPGIVLRESLPGPVAQESRATVGQVYVRVVDDLTEALRLIDDNYSQRTGDPIWIDREVILGLLVRVHLTGGEWVAVRDYADELLSTTQLSLSPTESYVGQWEANALSETLWALDLSRLTSPLAIGPGAYVGTGNEDPVIWVSEDLLGLFASDDIRRDLYPEVPEVGRLCAKYDIPAGSNAVPSPVLLRLSEVLLSRAEAHYELGEEDLARADLARLIQRARPGAAPVSASGEELRELIRSERRRELALEGHHFFDLKRWGASVERSDCAEFVVNCNLAYPDYRFALPIPREALFRNPNLTQNEGY
jgi:hypothetical protein